METSNADIATVAIVDNVLQITGVAEGTAIVRVGADYYKVVVSECKHTTTELVNKVVETCTTTGFTGDTVCSNCRLRIEQGVVTAALGHDWLLWKYVTVPTVGSEGEQSRQCSRDNCDATESRAVDARIAPGTEYEFDSAILAENAKANSEQWPARWTNDGKAAWAFDVEEHWWHSRYETWEQKGEHEVGTQFGDGKPTASNPIWIQTGFDKEWMVKKITYAPRGDTGYGIIKDYIVSVANLEDPTAEPKDSDFTEVKTGTLQNLITEQTIQLDEAVAATHVRITVTSVNCTGNNHVNAKRIRIYGHDRVAIGTTGMTVTKTGHFEGTTDNIARDIFDGDPVTHWTGHLTNGSLTVDLGTIHSMDRVDYTPRWNPVIWDGVGKSWSSNGFAEHLVVELSTDNVNWTKVEKDIAYPIGDDEYEVLLFPLQIKFAETKARYVRLSATNTRGWGGEAVNDNKHFAIGDLALYGEDLGGDITQASLSLDGDIALNIYTKLADNVDKTEANDDTYMEFTINHGDTSTTEKVDVKDAIAVTTGSYAGSYVFRTSLVAKQMSDSVTAKLVVDGKECESATTSIKDYATKQIANTASSENLVKLLKAMLNYGAEAQKQFNYRTDALANAGLNAGDQLIGDVTITGNVIEKGTNAIEGFVYQSTSTVLNSKTDLRHYFTYTGTLTGLSVTCTDTTVTPKIVEENGKYFVLIDNIAAKNLGTPYAVTISAGEGQSMTITANVYAYLNGAYNANVAKEVVKAMFVYGEAAKTYFAQ